MLKPRPRGQELTISNLQVDGAGVSVSNLDVYPRLLSRCL